MNYELITFIGGLKLPEILVIALVVLLLFGASKIPTMMRNLGKGVHSFKQGLEDAKQEINKEVKKATDTETEKPQIEDKNKE
ncbi:MAG: twin-arginine translocase TatA/TatE family subunit [Muribaculaceae bacterium]|nr:twin-arginine translocase TatA/TatE family subunit [Muribaculaceae bacterium]